MYPVLASGHVGHGRAQTHRLDEWLNEGGRLFTDDMCADNMTGASVGDDLADSFAVFHCPAVGGVAVVLYVHDEVESGLTSLRFGHADVRDLWVSEDGGGHEPVIECPQRRGIAPSVGDHVLSDDACFMVGYVFELIGRGHVPERVDALGSSTSEFVDWSCRSAERCGRGLGNLARRIDESFIAPMAPEPIAFALPNPDPDIHPEDAAMYAAIVARSIRDQFE